MKYDLSTPLHRKQFIAKCNRLLHDKATLVSLNDESTRTIQQNKYLHVLCRIMAMCVGETEHYAKEVYFKELANPEIFVRESVDKVTGEIFKYVRSTADLSKDEMTRAINNFRHWSEDHGYYLPDADVDDEGVVSFKSSRDAEAFHQADLETQRAGHLINIQD